MFENIKTCLDEYEDAIVKIRNDEYDAGISIAEYFHLRFTEALLKDVDNYTCVKIAKIILVLENE